MGQLRDNAEVDLNFLFCDKWNCLRTGCSGWRFEKGSECWSMCQSNVCHILQQDCAPLIS